MKQLARIIFADVPIKYNDRKETRKDNPGKKSKFGIGSDGHYVESMDSSQLCDMGIAIRNISAPDAYLFYWTTTPTAFGKINGFDRNGFVKPNEPSAMEVMAAWGFRYVSLAFSWEKLYPRSGETFEGGGTYVPSNVEWCLLGVRGRPWHSARGEKPQQVIRVPHPRSPENKIIHSRKPEEAQQRVEDWLWPQIAQTAIRHKQGVEEIVPVIDYEPYSLELFATREREGWKCLGHSLTGTDIRDDLKGLAE